jgi:hypothetical protein
MKRHLSLIVPVTAGVALIVLCSIVEGLWTERWGSTTSEELRAFVEAFNKIPMNLGDWEGERTKEEAEVAGAEGHLSANYHNAKIGETVSVYMICGASRNVSVHTPEACYPGAGFKMEGKTQKFTLRTESSEAEFTTAVFFKDEASGTQRLRLFWAWNAEGVWEAPDWPRMKYGGRRPLNKIYLIAPAPKEQQVNESPSLMFAELFLPEVDKVLFPAASAAAAGGPAAEDSASVPEPADS